MQVEQIFRRGAIYSHTPVTKSKKFWLPSKIMNCCPALDNNVLFGIVSKESYGCINYLELAIMRERYFYISRYQESKWCFFSVVYILFLNEDRKNKYFATKHKTYLIELYIVEMNNIMEVNENETFKIKNKFTWYLW
jgi:hypothetical protein